ncbi:secreted RxLR effector protein 161-like [Apium graveolens]|uniref:secreted RxLR effector protein 161-like n=1 Tax=Apium graveolens TaxID=4045 RepID=UPI003D79ED15
MGEMSYFLGLHGKHADEGIFINQYKYTKNLLTRFNMQENTTATTLMAITTNLDLDQGNEVDVTAYKYMIGSLLYLTASRPDNMYAICLCERFQEKPREPHLIDVISILRYLKGSQSPGLWYTRESNFNLIGFSYADFAWCKIGIKSTSDGCHYLDGRLVSWQNKKHKSISTSTAEAHYIVGGSYCAQILWMRNLLLDYGLPIQNFLFIVTIKVP